MPGFKPFTPAAYKEYNNKFKWLIKNHSTEKHTLKVMYKSLCPACSYNADRGKQIIYNCPHCRRRYWNNCSPKQVRSGEIGRKLDAKHGNIEWIKAYFPDGTLAYEWKKHENTYEQDYNGKWMPKNNGERDT